MSAVLNFDASQVAPDSGSQDALPAGWYDVMMVESEMKPTKGGDGAYLECKFSVIAPAQFQNRKVYTRLNLRNPNATAQEIGYKQLSAICHAVGVLQVADSAQLHNLPLKVKLKLRKATDDFEASNEITAFKNINEQVQMAGATAAPSPFGAPPAFGAPAAFPAAPVPPAPMAAPVPMAPAPAAPFAAAPQPWGQPAPAPQAAPAPMQAPAAPMMPAQPPAWGQAAPAQAPMAAPVPQPAQAAPVANPQVAAAAVATPPWMQQPQQ